MLELLFSSAARVKVLALLLLNPQTSFYQRQISVLTETRIYAVQREVERLQTLGLLTRFPRGNQMHFQVNRDFFLYPELRSIFLKTVGMTALVGDALQKAENVALAFIYGSYAANQEGATSDVDLFVVGDLSSRALHTALQEAEKLVHREINTSLFSPAEFRAKAQGGDGFLQNVLAGPKIFLVGDENVLRTLVA